MSHPSPGRSRFGARAVALAAVSSLALSGALAGAPVAQAAPDTAAVVVAKKKKPRAPRYPALNQPTDAGAAWIAYQLGSRGVMEGEYGPDYGLTADAGLALAAVGTRPATVQAVRGTLAANIADYVTGDKFGDADSTYAGSTAKAAVLAQVTGADPRNFGGDNLIARLENRVSTAGPSAGRISDKSTYGNFANTLGQAFTSRALTQARSPYAASATAFLLQQQCPSGYFRLQFTADETVMADGFLDAVGKKSVDIVVDPVGGDRFTDNLRTLRRDGRVLVIGFTGGDIPTVKVNRLLLNNIGVIGVGWGEYALAHEGHIAGEYEALRPHLESGALAPIVGSRYPLAEAAEALKSMESRTVIGKVVLTT